MELAGKGKFPAEQQQQRWLLGGKDSLWGVHKQQVMTQADTGRQQQSMSSSRALVMHCYQARAPLAAGMGGLGNTVDNRLYLAASKLQPLQLLDPAQAVSIHGPSTSSQMFQQPLCQAQQTASYVCSKLLQWLGRVLRQSRHCSSSLDAISSSSTDKAAVAATAVGAKAHQLKQQLQ